MRTGRLGRFAKLGGMAVGVAGDLAKARVSRSTHRAAAERLAATLGEMKGLPQKVGQILSTITEAMPVEQREIYREVLGRLQARAPAEDPVAMQALLAAELGAPPEEVFATFDPTPIAAASIGQVYSATLHDGREVVVKVQYPGIDQAIRSDLANVESLVGTLSAALPRTDLRPMLEDVVSNIIEELDYRQEAVNQAAFVKFWAGHPEIIVPAVVLELCTDRVLVSERVHGRDWATFLAEGSAEEKSNAGRIIWSFVFGSLNGGGMFNADPHPGNYLFLEDGRVAFLDFGCVQHFAPETVKSMAGLRESFAKDKGESEQRLLTRRVFGLDMVDDELWVQLRPYLALTMDPMGPQQPWRFDSAYTEKLMSQAMESKQKLAIRFMRKGIPTARQPGILFIGRINAGLASILCQLQAQADWPVTLRQTLEWLAARETHPAAR